jgi:hypothetical protein
MENGTEPRPGLSFNNPKAYPNTGKRFVLRIEAHTDGVPGMFHTPTDLMHWLSTHPYIDSIKLLEVGEEQHNVRKPPFNNAKKVNPTSKK